MSERSLITQIIAQRDDLKSQRGNWDNTLQEVAEYVLPRKAEFTRTWADGEQRNRELYDSTPEDAAQLLAAALHGLLTNPSTSWAGFRSERGGEEVSDGARQWKDDAINTFFDVLSREETSFTPQIHEFYLDLAAFCTGIFYSEEREGGISCRTYNIANVMFSENANGIVDSVYRTQQMTARQIAAEWGEDKVHRAIKECLRDTPEKRFEIVHAVIPRKDAKRVGARSSREKPFASYWIDAANQHLLSEGGYDEQPYNVARWSKSSGELLGRGPGLTALPFIRSLNAMALTAMMAAEKMADPPLIAPDDGFLGPINSGSGGISYYRTSIPGQGGDMIRPLPVSADLPAIQSMIEWRSNAIRRIFMNEQLQSFENPNMTATQVLAIQAEKMRVLGPVLGRLQVEFLSPFVNRVFNILLRQGVIPPPPPELQGKDLAVEYINPISNVQKQEQAQSFSQAVNYISPLVQTDPSSLDNFNYDAIVRDSQEIFGYPSKYLRAEEDVAQLREQRAQQQQAMMEAQLAKEAVDTAANAKSKGLMDDGTAEA